MDAKELPAMLQEVGIATEEQAAELLKLIQADEEEGLRGEFPDLPGVPSRPEGRWRART